MSLTEPPPGTAQEPKKMRHKGRTPTWVKPSSYTATPNRLYSGDTPGREVIFLSKTLLTA